MDLTNADQVMVAYSQIDQATESFQAATGLHCPPGCGQCCESPNVEATPLEMLPLALELFRRDDVDVWLERVADVQESGPCVFYKPDPLIPGNGRCQMYQWRPSICRLFGFAAGIRKDGTPELAACVRHKQLMPDRVAAAQTAIAQSAMTSKNSIHIPIFSDCTQAIANLDPHWGTERMPINRALRVALERVGLTMMFGERSE